MPPNLDRILPHLIAYSKTRKEGGKMKCGTRKVIYVLSVLLVLAIANEWGSFWKILVSIASILELIAIGSRVFRATKTN